MHILTSLQLFLSGHPFAEFAGIVIVVVLITIIMRLLRQPLIIGYIIAGILISPNVLNLLQHTENVQIFSHIGIALLLFMVGMKLNPQIIKDIGRSSFIIGLGQIVLTTGICVGISLLLGFSFVTSIYIALALAFSSTIIIIKLLSDKGKLDELYGKISIGVLIVQDIIAMIMLMVLSSLPGHGEIVHRGSFTGILLLKIAIIAAIMFVVTKYVLPRIMHSIAQSQEFLLIFAIARCLLFAAGMEMAGFSLEIGALLAGLSMAALPYRFEITSKMKPLRDFFIMLFFVFLGSQLQFSNFAAVFRPIVTLSLFVLIGKPFIVMVLMGTMGYTPKNTLLVGLTLAQVSEFSFILMGLALTVGHITDVTVISLVTIVGLITIAGSSYYFTFSERIYHFFHRYIHIFARNHVSVEPLATPADPYEVVVFGNHRTGSCIVDMLIKQKKKFIIVDYDPQVIADLQAQGIPCLYGDVSDVETLRDIQLQSAKMLISTVHDHNTNMLILQQATSINKDLVTILSANAPEEATNLYANGANYVFIPHVIGGLHTAMLIEQCQYDISKREKSVS